MGEKKNIMWRWMEQNLLKACLLIQPWLNDTPKMVHRSTTDNPWLNDEIRLILVKKYDWACVEPELADCDNCCAKEYYHYFD